MNPSDLDISIRLAVFMGWEEASTAVRDGIGTPVVTMWRVRRGDHPAHMDEVLLYPFTGGVEPWHPLLNPSHAALVMKEAARRGFVLAFEVDKDSCIAKVYVHDEGDSGPWMHHEIYDGAGIVAGWCRAVCRAVLYTMDAIQREAAITDHERLERSV